MPGRAALLLLAFPGLVSAAWLGPLFQGAAPENVGVGRLAPCPETPNCVSSLGSEDDAIAPIPFRGNPTVAMRLLASLASTMRGARIVTARPDYLHVEFVSRVIGFIDDFEAVPDPSGVIHLRSAARVGEGDFGVNRRRVERLRQAFVAAHERAARP